MTLPPQMEVSYSGLIDTIWVANGNVGDWTASGYTEYPVSANLARPNNIVEQDTVGWHTTPIDP
jgi:hypothetical protein